MTIEKIFNYIKDNYKNSCIAHNYDHGHQYLSEQEVAKECKNFFYYEKLNWCGCECPEEVEKEILKYFSILDWWEKQKNLKLVDDRYKEYANNFYNAFGVRGVYDNPLLLAFAYTMGAAEFTEHGTSISGAWLTEEGKMYLYLLRYFYGEVQ